ncbi:MAG TPA: hypothetical protein VNF47_03315 [Streptosporangiaceae bacterium]|nr:hypothetical protein [Streptosporangiaceae bacterium]
MTLAQTQDAALEPVRAALATTAAERAMRIVGEARQAAQVLTEQARRDADAAVAKASREGAAQAGPVAAAELGRGRRAARSVTLGADLATRDELAGRIRAAVLALRDEPDYPGLRDRLAELATRLAGSGAVVTDHRDGGVVARGPGILVDCSLRRLADLAVSALSARIAGLCGP